MQDHSYYLESASDDRQPDQETESIKLRFDSIVLFFGFESCFAHVETQGAQLISKFLFKIFNFCAHSCVVCGAGCSAPINEGDLKVGLK